MAYAKLRDPSLRAKLCSQKGNSNTLYRNWWVLLFIAACSIVYFNFVGKKNEVIVSLDQRLNMLQSEKHSLLQEKEDLFLQINSQSDPAWIQLTLMKGLGVVPEGQLKVYFCSDDD